MPRMAAASSSCATASSISRNHSPSSGRVRTRPSAMHLIQDVRFAARSFIKTPGVTIAAVLSIALGIAATTSVFTLVNALLFRPMPVPHPEQLVALYTQKPDSQYPSSFSYPDYREYRDNAAGLFSDLFA